MAARNSDGMVDSMVALSGARRRENARRRWLRDRAGGVCCCLRLGLLVALAAVGLADMRPAWAESPICPSGATMAIVAHEDDSILFMNPDLLHDIHGGRCVRTVFVTAGDAGLGRSYWSSREQGAEAAYAEMAGVADAWSLSDAGISGHRMPLLTLSGDPKLSIVFMRLPDGNTDGSGFPADHDQGLQKLYAGTISQLTAVDGSSSYTKSGLTSVLTSVMEGFGPDRIDTQDFVGSFGDGDHSDHHAVASFVRDAHRAYDTVPHLLIGYMDYQTAGQPPNVTGTDLTQKQNSWYAYAPYDDRACQTEQECAQTIYWAWLPAEYTVGSEVGGPGVSYPPPTADAGPDQRPLAGATVGLDGSGSSDLNASPSYHWTQTAGPAVSLSAPTSVEPTFTAPSGAATLVFQLVVTDGELTSEPSTVTITVSPIVATVGRVRVTGTTAGVRVQCAGASRAVCDVALRLSAIERTRSSTVIAASTATQSTGRALAGVVVLGSATATIAAGSTATVRISLNLTGKRLLSRRHALRTKLTVTQSLEAATKIVAIRTTMFTARAVGSGTRRAGTKKRRAGARSGAPAV